MNLFTGLINSDCIQLGITRQSIIENDISFALKKLNLLVATPEAVRKSSGALSLAVLGYDADPRELPEIPEVRRYFKALVEAFPYWFHVLNRIDDSLSLIFTLSADSIQIVRAPNGSFGTTYDTAEVIRFFKRHAAYLDSLHQLHHVSERDTSHIVSLVTNYYESKLGID
jgi:hypothetical protein